VTPKAAPVRKHLHILQPDATSILAHLGALAENANLLLCRCNLTEQQVFDLLGTWKLDDMLNMWRLEERDEDTTPRRSDGVGLKRQAEDVESDPEAVSPSAVVQASSSSSSHQVQPRSPPQPPPWRTPPLPPVVPPVPQVVALLPPVIRNSLFHHDKANKYFICDSCDTKIEFYDQNYRHDGDWVEWRTKRGQPIRFYKSRYNAGEDFTLHCMTCIAHDEGYGVGPQAEFEAREARGLNLHAQNRAQRDQAKGYGKRQRSEHTAGADRRWY
jgi:hypothetical protein